MNRKVLGVILVGAAYLGRDILKRVSTRHNREIARGKRFVILGGGFAGVEVSRELERLLPGEDNGEIVLVSSNRYLLFTPMLTEAVGGQISPHHMIVPLEAYTSRAKLLTGEIEHIDLKTRTTSITGEDAQKLTVDHLVICLGASSNFHHVPGVEAIAITMKTLADANHVRNNALSLLRNAVHETNPDDRAAMLTFLVAGGGYTGVETIAALNDLLRETAVKEHGLDASAIRAIIVEPLDRLMSEVTEDLAAYAQKELEANGVRVLLKTSIKSAEGDTVELSNGEKIRTRTFIWTAGVEANKLVAKLPAPKGKSKALKVSPELSLEAFDGIWAVGDCAAVPQPNGNGTYGATAQNATREGVLVARNIVRSLRSQPQQAFRYKPIGQLALVGRRKGVAQVYGYSFSGFIGYLLWRAVYLAKLPSTVQRARVLIDWVVDGVFGPAAVLGDVVPDTVGGKEVDRSRAETASA